MPETTITHVLLDADGVLQHIPDDWQSRLEQVLGEDWEEIARDLHRAEKPSLLGEEDFFDAIRHVLAEHGSTVTVEELYATLWRSIEQVPTSLELVARLRAAGYGVHLGTNQHAQRAAIMREELGYDDLFEVSVYSHAIGAKKPEAAYFERAAEMIGAAPGEVLFVDDVERNVEAARSVGMAAERWEHTEGLDALEARLAAHGVRPGPRRGPA